MTGEEYGTKITLCNEDFEKVKTELLKKDNKIQ